MNHTNHAFKELDQSLETLERLLTSTIDKILLMNDLNLKVLDMLDDKEMVQSCLQEARALDKEINQLEFEIVAIVQQILSKYNPRGSDLRFIIGSIKLSTILESIADKSKNNVKRLYKTASTPALQVIERLRQMLNENAAITSLVKQLLNQFDSEISASINIRRKRIEELYREIWLQETNVDADYHNIVMLAKNIERNADMIMDLKKIIYFIQTGEKLVKKKKKI